MFGGVVFKNRVVGVVGPKVGGVGRGKKKFGSGGYEVKWGKNEEKQ